MAAWTLIPTAAQPAVTGDVVQRLLDCRTLSAAAERLACFDAEAAKLQVQQKAHEVVVLDADEVRRTRRSLFGLTLPNLAILGESKASGTLPAEGVDQITETIKEARQAPYGQWIMTLASGSHWMQTDTEPLSIDPKPGMGVVIRRAALGSYMAKINGQRAIRVKRVQ